LISDTGLLPGSVFLCLSTGEPKESVRPVDSVVGGWIHNVSPLLGTRAHTMYNYLKTANWSSNCLQINQTRGNGSNTPVRTLWSQHSTFNNSTFNIQHSAIQHSTFNIQHSTPSNSAFDIQHSTFSNSTFNSSTFDNSTFNIQHSTIQNSTFNIQVQDLQDC